MSTTATSPNRPTTTWNIDPAHSVRRVQGEAHDDLQREGTVRQGHRDV